MAGVNEQLRLAIYARVSTDEQKEGQNIDSQIAELECFAKERGWLIAQTYKDEGWSGAVLARPALDHLRDDATKGVFDAVLINDVDRLARDVTHLGVVKRDLERKGIQVIFRKLPNESSPTHNLMVNILGSFAEFEREMIADRTRRGRIHKIEVRKEYLGGNTAYGYRYVPMDRATGRSGILQMVPEEATVVRQMFDWVDQNGLSARQVLQRLNDLKVRPQKGRSGWAKSSVLRILHNQTYAGVWHYNKHQAYDPGEGSGRAHYRKHVKSGMRRRPESEWIALPLPESLLIIDPQQWQRVQLQLRRNTAFSPRNEKHCYLLKSLIRCAGCGSRYVGEPCHGKFSYRCLARCKRCPSIREETLNEAVWNAVEEAILNPQLIIEQAVGMEQDSSQRENKRSEERKTLEHQLAQLDHEEKRLLEAYRLSVITPAQLGSELEKTKARRGSMTARIAQLATEATRSAPELKASITDYCHRAAENIKAFTFPERQRFLRILLKQITFDGQRATIQGEIPMPRPSLGNDPNEPSPNDNESSGQIANRAANRRVHNLAAQTLCETQVHRLHGHRDHQAPAVDYPQACSKRTVQQNTDQFGSGTCFILQSDVKGVWPPVLRDSTGTLPSLNLAATSFPAKNGGELATSQMTE